MIKNKSIRSKYDSCVYYSVHNGMYIYLLLYVDDMLIACKSLVEINKLKFKLSFEFEMKDLGNAKRILGMNIIRNRDKGTLLITQENYIDKILDVFGLSNAKVVSTPIGAQFKLCANQKPLTKENLDYMSRIPY